MAININLKEAFDTDSQSSLVEKLNFNFNQLIALGVGQPGRIGNTGDTGGPGPRGPIGKTGKNGTIIWSEGGGVSIDLSTSSPTDSVVGDYYIGKVIVGSVSYNGIYTKSQTGTVWSVITDFSEVFRDALNESGGELFPWRVGVNAQTPPARIMIPVNSAEGIDRITIDELSKPVDYYLTYSPNWKLTDSAVQNSQGVIFNFDTNTVKKIIANGSADSNGYLVKVTDSRLGSDVALLNEAFPYTSLLSLYSFFDSSVAPTKADQFVPTTGYRHQLELGSVDEIIEYLHTSDSGARYIISPTYQNLRIRKYRLPAIDIPGKSAIFSDFILSSQDSDSDPALNSKMEWNINKKTDSAFNNNSIVRMALTSSTLETSAGNVGLTGIAVDGLHMRLDHPLTNYRIAIGFDPTNYLLSTKNLLIKSNASITGVVFDQLQIIAKSGSAIIRFDSIGLTGQTGTDVGIYASDITKEVKIGSSSTNTALKIKGNRLSSAVPFPISIGALPPANSTDLNTLDEYQEGTFTPSVYFGTMPTPANGVLTGNVTEPVISNKIGAFVKIGKLVSFTIRFTISNWTITATAGRQTPPYYELPHLLAETVGVLSNVDDEWIGMQHAIGNEINQISIRDLGIFNHWPMASVSEKMKFDVSVSPLVNTGFGIRSFPMVYSWREGGNIVNTTYNWLPIASGTQYAKFKTYEDSITRPSLELYGNRMDSTISGVCAIESNLSIYDLLNYVHPTEPLGNTFEVVVNGCYITDHKTANDEHPIGVTTTTTTIGPTTTTTTTIPPSTTTTTTDPLAPTTTTTTLAPTTTTTTLAPTTTTTTSLYGPELVLNAGATGQTDWDSKVEPGVIGDDWQKGIWFEEYSIISTAGFTGLAQRTRRQLAKTGAIAIASNSFDLAPTSFNYKVTFRYRSSHALAVNKIAAGSPEAIGTVSANTGVSSQSADFTFNGNGTPFDYISFSVKTDGGSGPTIWFEIDEVSCKRIL